MVVMEMQAAYWAMTKCRLYLLGLQQFKLIVDHQPLATVLDKCTLDGVENPRHQRIIDRMHSFSPQFGARVKTTRFRMHYHVPQSAILSP